MPTPSKMLRSAAEAYDPRDRLLTFRDLADLSQSEAAEIVDVHRVTWARWESGDRRPDRRARDKFREAADEIEKGEWSALIVAPDPEESTDE